MYVGSLRRQHPDDLWWNFHSEAGCHVQPDEHDLARPARHALGTWQPARMRRGARQREEPLGNCGGRRKADRTGQGRLNSRPEDTHLESRQVEPEVELEYVIPRLEKQA